MRLPGIGPKTASWITRNWLGSDAVAILDVHVIRACCLMGLFSEPICLRREYEVLECKFLQFAENIGVRAAMLDALIWREMRLLGRRPAYSR
jgi:N-glycosylase/DNA lyase